MAPPKTSGMRDGWSKTGTLKTQQPKPGGLSMQGGFELPHGSGAQYYTAQFSVQTPPGGFFEAIADVTWSTDGTDVRRKLTVVNGAVISGTAQAVKISVVDATPFGPFPGEEYRVDIAVTPGCRPSQQQPPRLYAGQFSIPSGGGAVGIPIPQDAGVISVNIQAFRIPTAPLGAGDAVALFGNLVPFGGFTIEGDGDGWVPVPPGANLLELFNLGPATVVYGVTWGIEG
jgi:hypothetical protein